MTSTPITRADLDPDPGTAYQQITSTIAEHLEVIRNLTLVKDQLLRQELVGGDERGGVARASRVAGVTHTQVGRLLVEGLVRAVRAAARTEGIDVRTRSLGQAHPARVAVFLAPGNSIPPDFTGEDPDAPDYDNSPDAHLERAERERAWRYDRALRRNNDAGALLVAFRAAGLAVTADGGDLRDALAADDGEWVVSWRQG